MTKQDRQKLLFLVILLAVLAATITLGYRMNRPPTTTTAAAQQPEQKISSNPPAASDARIRLDLVENPNAADEDAGKRNLFQYGQPPAPPITARPPLPNTFPPPVNTAPSQAVPRPPGPVTPPPPPPINLKFQGLFTVKEPGGALIAVVADDSRHYNVKTGEILMGRYRIASISDKQVEVEDLEYNRRQTLPLLK